MKYERKTRDVWVMESNYGYGWDPEVEEETWRDMRQTLKEYRENCPEGQFRAIKHRELRELSPMEHVHHINGDITDNRIENLQIVSRYEHANRVRK